jgi:hypothetical protein
MFSVCMWYILFGITLEKLGVVNVSIVLKIRKFSLVTGKTCPSSLSIT